MLTEVILLFVQTLILWNLSFQGEIENARRRASYRDWGNIAIGDTVIAYRNVPEVIEHAIQFYKGEVCEVRPRSVAIRDKYGDVGWFQKSQYSQVDFIGDFFE